MMLLLEVLALDPFLAKQLNATDAAHSSSITKAGCSVVAADIYIAGVFNPATLSEAAQRNGLHSHWGSRRSQSMDSASRL